MFVTQIEVNAKVRIYLLCEIFKEKRYLISGFLDRRGTCYIVKITIFLKERYEYISNI